MIESVYEELILVCDICGEQVEGFRNFDDVLAAKEDLGWITSRDVEDEWLDVCPDCQGEE